MPQRLEHTEVEESHTPCRVIDFSLLSCLPQKGKKCIRTPKISKPIKFELSGCTSMKTYRAKFCGVCTDGRCCTPHRTTTLPVEFKCPDGEVMKKSMMFIKTCACHYNCPETMTSSSHCTTGRCMETWPKARDSETCEHFRLSLESIHISFLCTRDFSGTSYLNLCF